MAFMKMSHSFPKEPTVGDGKWCSMREPILTVTCDCGHFQDMQFSRIVAQPAVECRTCGRVTHVPEATLAAVFRRYGGEVLDLSRWEPPKARLEARRAGIA